MIDSKMERQRELERTSVADGVVRYRDQVSSKDLSAVKPGKQLLSRSMVKLIAAIDDCKGDSMRARRGKPSVFLPYFAQFESDVLAYAVARHTINTMGARTPVTLPRLAMNVATALHEALLYEELQPLEPNLFSAMERKARRATTTRHAKAVMNRAANVTQEKHGTVTGLPWTDKDKLLVGARLVELFIEATGLAQITHRYRNRKSQNVVEATPATLEWINNQHDLAELLEPIYLPMVIPPVDWTQPIGGGYLSQCKTPSIPMIKCRDRDTIDEYFSTDMPEVYDALNIIQQTAWRINKPIYDALCALQFSPAGVAGLPAGEMEPIPAKPGDIATNEEARKAWRAQAAEIHTANAREASRRIALAQQLHIAKLMIPEGSIWFPHSMDFRGRIYPIPHVLNPQANDSGKALLEFAEGKPLGENGAYWLHVHVANLFGVDKVSLDDRVQWTRDNMDKLLDSGMDPLDGQRYWMEADKPFCALAACIELLGYSLEGEDYVSHIPVAMDGSCSGLQHYSALLRDEIGGSAVNLTPRDRPADIYTAVARQVEAHVAENNEPADKAWRGLVKRIIVKRPCMTYAYSVTYRGIRDQLRDEMFKQAKGNYVPGYENWDAANHLAPVVRASIAEVVVAASAAMEWLQSVIKQLNAASMPCMWMTPVGLPVVQAEKEYKAQRVRLLFEGRTVSMNYAIQLKTLNKRRQISGIAPNFIHSMDAGHLMKTVIACNKDGMFDFAMIHDSFGCHAADVDLMNHHIRAEFVKIYQHNWLQDFKEQAEALLGEEVPPIPAMGQLDLTEVEKSDFFFS